MPLYDPENVVGCSHTTNNEPSVYVRVCDRNFCSNLTALKPVGVAVETVGRFPAVACVACRPLPLKSLHWLTLFDPSSVMDEASEASSQRERPEIIFGVNGPRATVTVWLGRPSGLTLIVIGLGPETDPVNVTELDGGLPALRLKEAGNTPTDASDELMLTSTGDSGTRLSAAVNEPTLPGETRSSVRLVGVTLRLSGTDGRLIAMVWVVIPGAVT